MTAMPTKHCNRCGTTKPIAEFYTKNATTGRFKSQCKTCECELERLRRPRKQRVAQAFVPDATAPREPNRRLPLTRSECENRTGPCLFVSCRHHLYLEVTGHGRIVLNYPGLEPDELTVSCSLDVAADGEAMTLEAVGELTGIGRERVRQVEEIALRKLKRLPVARRLRGLDQ